MAMVVRYLVAFVLAEGWLSLAVLVALALAVANFVVGWQSFVAQGYEQFPLRQLPALGPWMDAVGFGDAPLAALYALMLTAAMNMMVISSTKMAFVMVRCFFDRRAALRSGSPELRAQVPSYEDKLLETAVLFIPLLWATVLVVRFDVAQFELRYTGLFLNLRDPGEMLHWAPAAAARLGIFLASFLRKAVWGYVGAVVGIAWAMEYAFLRAGERWQALHHAVEQAIQGDPETRHRTAGALVQAPVPADPAASPHTEREPGLSSPAPVFGGAPADSLDTGEAVPEPVAPPPPADPPPVAAAPEAGPEVDVIVGPGETRRVRMAEIEDHPEEFVRDGSGRAWFRRSYYEGGVMGGDAGEDGGE